jgi:hypothetical protein
MVYMVYMVYMFVFLVPRLHDPTINFFNDACVYFLYTSCVFWLATVHCQSLLNDFIVEFYDDFNTRKLYVDFVSSRITDRSTVDYLILEA